MSGPSLNFLRSPFYQKWGGRPASHHASLIQDCRRFQKPKTQQFFERPRERTEILSPCLIAVSPEKDSRREERGKELSSDRFMPFQINGIKAKSTLTGQTHYVCHTGLPLVRLLDMQVRRFHFALRLFTPAKQAWLSLGHHLPPGSSHVSLQR